MPLRPLCYLILVALPLLTLLSGCGVISQQQVPLALATVHTIEEKVSIGQTLLAHHDGLAGVEVYLLPQTPGAGTLELRLFASRAETVPLATSSLPIAAVAGPDFYRFTFAPALLSRQRDYYLELRVSGLGSVQAGAAPGDSYRDGALYLDGRPQEAQLVHGLIFERGAQLGGFVKRIGSLLLALLAGVLLYVVPGLALLRLAWPGSRKLSWGEQLGLGIGLSVAALPLWLVWAQLLELRLGAWHAWGLVLLGVAGLAWSLRGARPSRLRSFDPAALPWFDLGLAGVIALIVLPRLITVGSLEAPSWGDSVQHTVIAQLILDNGGLFDSWQPYVPYVSLTVQFGFSALVAGLAWMLGASSVDATILAGQLLNAGAIIALYPLALRFSGGRRWAGLVALLVAGLLSPLPGFYVNWGRYAQLSGQIVLPVAIWLSWALLAERGRPWREAGLVALSVAGMVLCYYRLAFFYAIFMAVLLLCWAVPAWRARQAEWQPAALWIGLAGTLTGLLFLPWAIHVSQSRLSQTMVSGVQQGTPLWYVLNDYQVWWELPRYLPAPLLVASGAALLWALWRRQWALLGLGLWALLMSLYMAGSLIRLPGALLMQSFAVIIALYIPVALLCGWLWSEVAGLRRGAQAIQPIAALLFLGLAGWGAVQQLRVIDPAFMLVTRPDVRAMRWIAAETPADAQFLVQGFTVFNGQSAVGADAGWWIPLLARRSNTMPPHYALNNEAPAQPDYTLRVLQLYDRLQQEPPPSPNGLRLLCTWGITHVYDGQGQGRVGFGADPIFTADELRASPYFRQEYREDRVSIFAFDRAACAAAGSAGAGAVP